MIEPEVAALFEGPSSLIVGTADAHAHPEAIRGVRASRSSPTDRLRILLAADAQATRWPTSPSGGAIAITATNVATNASVQVKGRAAPAEPETPADRVRHERYIDGFFGVINESDGTPRRAAAALKPPGSLRRARVSVEELFDQTPGPAAGRSLLPTGTLTMADAHPVSLARDQLLFRGHHPGGDRDGLDRRHTERDPPHTRAPRRRRAGRAVEPVLLEDGPQPRREPDARACC